MSQTSYQQYQDAAVAGLKGGLEFDQVESVKAAEALLDGHFVALGAGEELGKLPAAATDITDLAKARGVVVRDLAREFGAAGAAQYAAESMVPVMRKGRIWVVVEDAIVVGTSTVNVRYAGSGQKGAFAGAAVAMETAVLPNAKWIKGTSGAGLALLEVNL